MQEDSLRKDFAKAILWSLLALFLIPAACLWFTTHSLAEDQAKLNRAVAARMAKDPRLSTAEREEIQSFYARHPVAQLCRDDAPEAARFRAASCPAYGELWQFTWMRLLSIATLVAGAALLAESLLAAPELEAPLRPGRREGRSVDGRYHWVLEAHPYPQSPLPPGRGRMLLQLQLEVRWGQGGQLRWDSLRLVPEARGGGR